MILNPTRIVLSPIVGLDLETTGLRAWEEKVRLIIIITDSETYVLEPDKYSTEFISSVFEAMCDCSMVIAQNAKFDCGFIYSNYGVLLTNWWCTLIASQILTNGKDDVHGHSLKDVLQRYLGVSLTHGEDKKLLQKSFTTAYFTGNFSSKQLTYAVEDVKYLPQLQKVQEEKIKDLQLTSIIELENKLIPVLSKMEVQGVLIDKVGWQSVIEDHWKPTLHAIEHKLDQEVDVLRGYVSGRNKQRVISFDLFGHHTEQIICSSTAINYASPSQIIELFRELEEPVPTHPGPRPGEITESVDDPTLSKYVNENPGTRLKTFIRILKDYREQSKLLSTYGESFLAMLDKNSHIHTLYTQSYTKTGRLSSKEPNLQNIPSPSKSAPHNDVRKFFIARPGYKLITCDMASAEVCIAADYSQEPLLLDAILRGTDMHSELASITFSIIFGKPVKITNDNQTIHTGLSSYTASDLRQVHKTVLFAKFYKAGANRVYSTLAGYINPLYETLKERLEIAGKVSRALDKKMPKLNQYLTSLINKAHEDGFLRTSKLGRIRYFNTSHYGECANAPIQGTNAEAIKIAMLNADKYFEDGNIPGRLCMNVHDELVCEVKEEFAEEAAKAIQKIVGNALGFFLTTVPGKASVEINNHWKK